MAGETVMALVAIGVAYLVGAFPSAYIITRALTGKDIRQLGSGNAGANNTFHEVGPAAGVAVGVMDVAKGTAAVAVAHWLVDAPFFEPHAFVLLAGIAAASGHMWSVYLRFRGGNGLAPTIGMLAMTLPREMLITAGIIVVLIAFTRNVVLSANIGLLSVPFSAWFLERGWLYAGLLAGLALVIILNFLPTAKAALDSAGSARALLTQVLRKNRASVPGKDH